MVVAINLMAVMSARHNYRTKELTRLTRQIGEATVIWCGIRGMLLLVGFMMKISTGFSRGSVILSFVLDFTGVECYGLSRARNALARPVCRANEAGYGPRSAWGFWRVVE